MDIFRPDIYQKSIYSINYQKLKKAGIKCLIFDLDNTIAPKEMEIPDEKILNFFGELDEMGFYLAIISNASKKRVTPFKEKCNINSAYHSFKPSKKKYLKVMNLYQVKDIEVACIGDQLLTDILGANKLQLTSILVNPINDHELFLTKINRFIENKIIKKLTKKGLFKKGVYYD